MTPISFVKYVLLLVKQVNPKIWALKSKWDRKSRTNEHNTIF